ncbi:hypothetical protein AB0K08_01230 [Citricoccus sp. NPDC055426]|uniref:hypothetical protein n=1 Tax=Citricoccus sp. NPDC055426 TaxID=3155536 RepID=UPI0034410F63
MTLAPRSSPSSPSSRSPSSRSAAEAPATATRPRSAAASEGPGRRRSVLIIAGSRDRGAVAAARSLRAAGWTVGAGVPDAGGGLVGGSNAVAHVHRVPRPRGDASDFLAAIRAAHAEVGYELLVGAGDDSLSALSHYRDRLPARVAHPPAVAVKRAGDKLLLSRWAEDAGLAAPETLPATAAVLDRLTARDFPLVVKNRRHWRPGQLRPLRLETRVCADHAELRDALAAFRADGDEPILQQYRPGRLGALIGLFHNGRLVGRVQQESPRLWPTPAGSSARARTVPVDRTLAASAERLLARVEWSGLVELQFLISEDGVHRLIDLNGRYFGSLALTERARPGLVDAWARQATDRYVPWLQDGEVGLRYQWFPGDVRRALVERRNGLVADLGGTLCWALRSQHSVFRAQDPGPAVSLITGSIPRVDGSEPAGSGSRAEPAG